MNDFVLIGGQAMIHLGLNRTTLDHDYLGLVPDNKRTFVKIPGGHICNASVDKFFMKIYLKEKGNEVATPQSMLELKCRSFVERWRNGHFEKANNIDVSDITFLVNEYAVTSFPILSRNWDLSIGEKKELKKIIKEAKKTKENIPV